MVVFEDYLIPVGVHVFSGLNAAVRLLIVGFDRFFGLGEDLLSFSFC